MLTLQTLYQKLVDNKKIDNDPVQRHLLNNFQALYDKLTLKKNLLNSLFRKSNKIKGLYLHGGVGIGKTFLMDLFFDSLPFKEKTRLHFHSFMQNIQQSLTEHQGKQNPLEVIAIEISSKTKVICFDEFFVKDIADAMILERLFNSLFAKGVTLVATSNISPSQLYLNGLHRSRFIPAIKLIEKNCLVINVESSQDYRFRQLTQSQTFFVPNNKSNHQKMSQLFKTYSQGTIQKNQPIRMQQREILTKQISDNAVWFDFNIICHTPRSQVDYLNIAELFKVVFISDVPIISSANKVSITYFIHLVDVFYDKKIKLILSAETEIDNIYVSGDKVFEFQRTVSRLQEMRSEEYLKL